MENEKHERIIQENKKEKCKNVLASAMAKLRADKIKSLRYAEQFKSKQLISHFSNTPKMATPILSIPKIKEESMETFEYPITI